MAIKGNLNTMPLEDLFKWVVDQSATGMLELERNRVRKKVTFRNGEIAGCISNDPPSRIGQFLLARGKISKDTLERALQIHAERGQSLGSILQDMGEIEAEEFSYELSNKAEETVLSLFDWDHAVFEFHPGECGDPWLIDFTMPIDEVVKRGRTRRSQLASIRRLFASSGVVLGRTGQSVPGEVRGSALARRIFESVDGERTLGELVLHARASEFLVVKFLASMVHSGLLLIKEIRPFDPEAPTLLDGLLGAVGEAPAAAVPAKPRESADAPCFEDELERAQTMLSVGEVEGALDLLDALYERRPDSEFLRHLTAKAETAYLESCRQGEWSSHARLERVSDTPLAADDNRFSAAERFLLGLIEEGHSVQTLLWIAPMREVDLYRTLARMRHARLIDVREATAEEESSPAIRMA